MRRGEVWWAELPAPVGSRPVIILTRDSVLHSIGSVVAVLVTRTVRGLPTEVILGRQQGLPSRCVANFDNILTVPRDRLKRLMGACDASKLQRSPEGIHFCSPKGIHSLIRVWVRERSRRIRAVEAVKRRMNSIIHAEGVGMILQVAEKK